MIISYKNKFIFVHIPKCAGISIATALQPYGREKKRSLISYILKVLRLPSSLIPKKFNKLRFIENRHIKAYKVKSEFGHQCWNNSFTFGIVRNPWDWEVSHYHYILKTPDHKYHKLICSLKDFNDFVHAGMKIASKPNVFYRFLFIDGKQGVDFVARLETLDRDFSYICFQNNISDEIIALPHRNKTKHNHYSKYYNSETIEIVREHHAKDIDVFNYRFSKK